MINVMIIDLTYDMLAMIVDQIGNMIACWPGRASSLASSTLSASQTMSATAVRISCKVGHSGNVVRFFSLFWAFFLTQGSISYRPDFLGHRYIIAGVCLSPRECSERGGLSEGSCASGFGACCLFISRWIWLVLDLGLSLGPGLELASLS